MIDRLFAIWQALYPDSYVEPEAQTQSTYWYNQGDVLDADSGMTLDYRNPTLTTLALKPFSADPSGHFWTSNSCRDPRSMGYVYPEIASGQQSDVVAAVNQLYGSGAPGKASKSRRKRSPSVARSNATSSDPAEYLFQINFRAPKNGVDSSWFIDFFIGNGPKSEDPNTWLGDPNLIGSHAIIAMQNPQMPQVTVTGVVMLNHFLQTMVAEGRLASMELDTVLTMLQDQIAWRIKTVSWEAPGG